MTLISRWLFDSAAVSGTTVKDVVGGHDGTWVGTPAYIAGKIGDQAFSGDGATQYVTVVHHADFQPADAFSLTCWLKVTALDIFYQAIFTKGDGCWRLARNGNNSNIDFATNSITVAGSNDMTSNANIDDGNWHHVAAVWGGAANATKYLYIDGALDKQGATSGSLDSQTNAIWIGNNSDATSRFWHGGLDDVRFYNHGLTASEVQLLYRNPVPRVALLGKI